MINQEPYGDILDALVYAIQGMEDGFHRSELTAQAIEVARKLSARGVVLCPVSGHEILCCQTWLPYPVEAKPSRCPECGTMFTSGTAEAESEPTARTIISPSSHASGVWGCADCGHAEPFDPTYHNHRCPRCASDEWRWIGES